MCNDLVTITGLSQPTISQHLTEIKKAGLLKTSFKGKNLYYSLNQEKWMSLLPFNSLFIKLTKISNRISNAN